MRFSYFALLLCSVMIAFSCSRGNLLIEDTSNNFHEIAIVDLTTSTFDNDASSVFSLRNGTQKINDNQTNDDLERGVAVPIPIFSEETVNVDMGSWVTVRFSVQGILLEGSCPSELTNEQIDEIIADTSNDEDIAGMRIWFDSEEIDVLTNFRTEKIYAVTNNNGNCQFINPWRYYVNPQSAGDHELKTLYDGVEYSRTISWVKKEKPTK